MRITKLMGFAVILVALALTLNALAFKTATVTNPTTFAVTATGSAAVAIEAAATPGTGFTASFASNYLQLTINDNVQRNSVYLFKRVFQVTHKGSNTTDPISVSASVTGLPAGVTVNVYEAGTSTPLSGKSLASTASVAVDIEITIATGATVAAGQTFNIVINATQDA